VIVCHCRRVTDWQLRANPRTPAGDVCGGCVELVREITGEVYVMGVNGPTTERTEDRKSRAWALRVGGKTYRQIGLELGISHTAAYKHVQTVLKETRDTMHEEARDHIALQLSRIDIAINRLMPMIDECEDPELSLAAMDRLDKLERRRAALLGLDAPKQTELLGSIDVKRVDPQAAAALVRQKFGEHAAKSDTGETPRDAGEVPVDATGE